MASARPLLEGLSTPTSLASVVPKESAADFLDLLVLVVAFSFQVGLLTFTAMCTFFSEGAEVCEPPGRLDTAQCHVW